MGDFRLDAESRSGRIEGVETVSQSHPTRPDQADPPMDVSSCTERCSTCPGRFVCRCLRITEEMLVEALAAHDLRTVTDIRRVTGAGDGCTCCHKQIRALLEVHVSTGALAAAG